MTTTANPLRRRTPADERVAELERQIEELRVYAELPKEVRHEALIRALRQRKPKK